MLTQLRPILQNLLPFQSWLLQQEQRARDVALAHAYVDGQHRSSLTDEMRNMLRIASAQTGSPFNVNHMDVIVQTLVDRLTLLGLETDNDAADDWFAEQLRLVHLDGIQIDVHEAAIRDGDAFLMVDYDNDAQQLRLTPEPAFDGTSGMLMAYAPDQRTPLVAIKIWQEIEETARAPRVVTRTNLYYPDRVEKYRAYVGSSRIQLIETLPWLTLTGDPIGIPVVHFRNRSARTRTTGRSEIADAIPLQDALNRTLVSMIMAAELTAFAVRYAIGLKAPAAITPGMWINAYARDKSGADTIPDERTLQWLSSIRFGTLDQGEIAPFIEQAEFTINQMYAITRTPRLGESETVSGESLKQREVALIGKAKRAIVTFGNSWEQAGRLMHRVATTFSPQTPPPFTRITSSWLSPELRDSGQTVQNVLAIADRVDERTVLQLLAPVFNWDSSKIDEILARRPADLANRLAALQPPDFAAFQL